MDVATQDSRKNRSIAVAQLFFRFACRTFVIPAKAVPRSARDTFFSGFPPSHIGVKIRSCKASESHHSASGFVLPATIPPLDPPVNGGKCVPSPLTGRDREGGSYWNLA